MGQGCPWVGLTHGSGWVELFLVFRGLGWVPCSKSTKKGPSSNRSRDAVG